MSVDLGNTNPQVSQVTFNSANAYSVMRSGTGSLTLSNTGSGLALVVVTSGTHAIGVPVNLASSVEIDPAAGQELDVTGDISDGGNGLSLTLNDAGTLKLSGVNTYSGPTTLTNGTMVFDSSTALADASSLIVGADAASIFGLGRPVTLNGSSHPRRHRCKSAAWCPSLARWPCCWPGWSRDLACGGRGELRT